MKLGGITWWRYNYGSILQAYALQTELNSYEDVEYEIICQYGKQIVSINNLKEKLARLGIRKTVKRIVWKFGLRKLRDRNNRIQQFVDSFLLVSEQEYTQETISEANKNYDGFVCGSDQIWNVELTDVDSFYWLGFASKDKLKVSYAPSVGVDSFTKAQAESIKRNLQSFSAISTREDSGTSLINRTLGVERCITVVDPTILIDRSIWDKLSEEPIYDQKYVFVYLLRGTKKQRKLVERFAQKRNLKIVTIPFLDAERIEPYDFLFGNIKLWSADPIDFIRVIRYAEYVFTDSFHSMLFCSLYHIDFFVFPKIGKAQLNRVADFQKKIQVEGRLLKADTKLEEIENAGRIDWSVVDQCLEKQRLISKTYLDRVLKGQKTGSLE